MTKTEHTAVIGAGLAGLTCAQVLADAGQSVVVFDKG
ncbi:MAG: putative NAD/FAD-dependent oxidoreductase, partial [Yoonia sp.]